MVFATRGKKHRKYRGFGLPRRKKHRYLELRMSSAWRVSKKNKKTHLIWRFWSYEIKKKTAGVTTTTTTTTTATTFPHRSLNAQKSLCTAVFTQTLLHTDAFTQKNFYTEACAHSTVLHTTSFYTERLCFPFLITYLSCSPHVGFGLLANLDRFNWFNPWAAPASQWSRWQRLHFLRREARWNIFNGTVRRSDPGDLQRFDDVWADWKPWPRPKTPFLCTFEDKKEVNCQCVVKEDVEWHYRLIVI